MLGLCDINLKLPLLKSAGMSLFWSDKTPLRLLSWLSDYTSRPVTLSHTSPDFRAGMHAPVSLAWAHLRGLLVSCCFLLLSSTNGPVSVWQPRKHSAVNTRWTDSLLVVCGKENALVHKACISNTAYLVSSFGCVLFPTSPCTAWKGHWHLMCLSQRHDSGLFVSSSIVQ